MRNNLLKSLSLVLVAITLGLLVRGTTEGDVLIVSTEAKSDQAGPQPVDDDMHHFMEYVFEPNYKRLKVGLSREPQDRNVWKAIKGDSLTLAECANLLLNRVPDEDATQWRELSIAVRTRGGQLYQAARKSDYTAARRAYVAMLEKCNSCHKQFADGEHQLRP